MSKYDQAMWCILNSKPHTKKDVEKALKDAENQLWDVDSIEDGSILVGAIQPRKAKLVQAWIEIHRESLMTDWALAMNGEPLFQIDPLR